MSKKTVFTITRTSHLYATAEPETFTYRNGFLIFSYHAIPSAVNLLYMQYVRPVHKPNNTKIVACIVLLFIFILCEIVMMNGCFLLDARLGVHELSLLVSLAPVLLRLIEEGFQPNLGIEILLAGVGHGNEGH